MALCAALAGCGSASAKPEARPSAIEYTKGGGFAPILERLHIGVDGRAKLTVGFPSDAETKHFGVARKRLESIRSALAEAQFGQIPEAGPPNCADCFAYAITYRGHTVNRSESDVPERLVPALRQLSAIVAAHAG